MKGMLSNEYRPFLRWAGGKSWLLRKISLQSNFTYNNYHEPFLGGGAVFFYLRPKHNSYLSDLNPELVNCYSMLRDKVEDVIDILRSFKNESDFYYKIRNETNSDGVYSAARFIYLNQTSFNGIYRVNLNGVYNVPYGNRVKDFINADLLRAVSFSLQNVVLNVGDFSQVLNNVNVGDLVFLDPPYTVTHNDNGFIKYNEKLFSFEDQLRLSQTMDLIHENGAFYILTNADHHQVREIFTRNENNCYQFSRASLIGGFNAFRGHTSELVFSNIDAEFNFLTN